MMKKLFFLLMMAFIPLLGMAQNPSIDTFEPVDSSTGNENEYTLTELIDDVLIEGECAIVENVQSPNNSFDSGASFQSYGYFSAGDDVDFPFEDGLIMAANGVEQAEAGGMNQGSTLGWEGDEDLEALIQDPGNTNNATVITFDFIPFVPEISFRYLMASDEYGNFVCTFADVFAFILSGPGISDVNSYDHDANPNTPDVELDLGGLNIATLQGTNIPAAITNVHISEDCSSGSLGEFAAGQYYDIDGSNTADPNYGDPEGQPGFGFQPSNISYNGQTMPLTASAEVIPGEQYQIKLAVADQGDSSFDTAVFIEGQSFSIGIIDLPDVTLDDPEAQCDGEELVLDTGFPESGGDDISFLWYNLAEDPNEPLEGEEGPALTVTESGEYAVFITVLDSEGNPLLECSNSATAIVEFFTTPEVELDDEYLVCGETNVDLDVTPDNIDTILDENPEGPEYTWFLNGEVIEGEDGPEYTATEPGIYDVEIVSGSCELLLTTEVVGLEYMIDLGDGICVDTEQGTEIIPEFTGVDPNDVDVSYEWSTGESTETITVTEAGTYSLTTTILGCEETAEVEVSPSHVVDVSDVSVCDSDLSVVVSSGYDSEDVTEVIWQDESGNEVGSGADLVLDWSEAQGADAVLGNYTVTVTIGGCSITDTFEIDRFRTESGEIVQNCVIPEGISPNADGINDCFDLAFLTNRLSIESVQIFNRYGRKIFESSDYENEFCGQDEEGNNLVTGTYFYVIKFAEGDDQFDQVERGWLYINREQQ
ncbi:MAG: choice-of-anchor L domain-containing protein [Bacteroidota bacterium]